MYNCSDPKRLQVEEAIQRGCTRQLKIWISESRLNLKLGLEVRRRSDRDGLSPSLPSRILVKARINTGKNRHPSWYLQTGFKSDLKMAEVLIEIDDACRQPRRSGRRRCSAAGRRWRRCPSAPWACSGSRRTDPDPASPGRHFGPGPSGPLPGLQALAAAALAPLPQRAGHLEAK